MLRLSNTLFNIVYLPLSIINVPEESIFQKDLIPLKFRKINIFKLAHPIHNHGLLRSVIINLIFNGYSENVFDLITHEYGHILTNVDDAYFLARPGIIKTVSTYGQSSNSETIAELFLKSRKVGLGNLTDEEAQFLNQYIGG